MIARSIRLRLIAFAAIAIACALGAAWYVIGALFEHYTEQRMAMALIREGEAIIQQTTIASDGSPVVDPTDLEAPFRRPGSGLYWEVRSAAKMTRSASLAGKHLAAAVKPRSREIGSWRELEIPGPYEPDLIVVERWVKRNGHPVLVRVGQDDEPLDRAQDSFVNEMALFLSALGIALALAAWIQVELGLWPLSRVRKELEAMQRNPEQRLGDAHPNEIEPLVAAINALADARGDDLIRARRRAADLAHALKTPLAALAAQSRLARAAGAENAADAIDQTLSTATAALETELARARAAASRTGAARTVTRPAALMEQLFAVLARTEAGMSLAYDADIPANWTLAVESDTFAEIFGNLLDNATRHARRLIRTVARIEQGNVYFDVIDDGPGISEEQRDTVLRRGVRLDESGPGHGLGLAIVLDLVEATSGTLSLATAPGSGLIATVAWPIVLLTSSEE